MISKYVSIVSVYKLDFHESRDRMQIVRRARDANSP